MRTIMVVNAKGGSGKSTLATHLAGYFARQGQTALKDLDPQGSSNDWLAQRPASLPAIHGIRERTNGPTVTRTWQLRAPLHTRWQVVDTPGGFDPNRFVTEVRKADRLLIPVVPSPIDIRATAAFLKTLAQFRRAYAPHLPWGVVANRVAPMSPAFFTLQRIFTNLDIPFIASLSESMVYLRAAQEGLSLWDMDEAETARERQEWVPLIAWVAGEDHAAATVAAMAE